MNSKTDECSGCKAPVHRICQAQAEANNDWTRHGEQILFCNRCHPDAALASGAAATHCRPCPLVSDVPSRTPVEAAADSGSTNVAAPPDASADAIAKCRWRNKGGRPKGSTNAKKREDALKLKKAVNWVTVEYELAMHRAKEAREESGGRNRVKVADRMREKLVDEAKERFSIEVELDVPRQTIHSRIKAERLEVWHTGKTSPMIIAEIALNAYIITAWQVQSPLSVGDCIELMNNLITATQFAHKLIAWKIKKGIYNSL